MFSFIKQLSLSMALAAPSLSPSPSVLSEEASYLFTISVISWWYNEKNLKWKQNCLAVSRQTFFLVYQNLQEKFALLQSSLCEEKPNQYLLCWKVCPHAAHISMERNTISTFALLQSSLCEEKPNQYLLCWKVCPHAAHISVKRKPTSTFYVEKSAHMQHTSLQREILPVPSYVEKPAHMQHTSLWRENQPVSLYI